MFSDFLINTYTLKFIFKHEHEILKRQFLFECMNFLISHVFV